MEPGVVGFDGEDTALECLRIVESGIADAGYSDGADRGPTAKNLMRFLEAAREAVAKSKMCLAWQGVRIQREAPDASPAPQRVG